MAIRQLVEALPDVGIMGERSRKVGRHSPLAWRGVKLKIDIDLVASLNACGSAVFGADPEHEFPAVHSHSVAVGMTVDRHAHGRPLARPERCDNLGRNAKAGGSFAG